MTELDKRFDDGEDAVDLFDDLFDPYTLKRPALKTQTISISLPQWMISALDRSVRLDRDRQSTIKFWIAERLESAVLAQSLEVDM